jgi:hypothetical protein
MDFSILLGPGASRQGGLARPFASLINFRGTRPAPSDSTTPGIEIKIIPPLLSILSLRDDYRMNGR